MFVSLHFVSDLFSLALVSTPHEAWRLMLVGLQIINMDNLAHFKIQKLNSREKFTPLGYFKQYR